MRHRYSQRKARAALIQKLWKPVTEGENTLARPHTHTHKNCTDVVVASLLRLKASANVQRALAVTTNIR